MSEREKEIMKREAESNEERAGLEGWGVSLLHTALGPPPTFRGGQEHEKVGLLGVYSIYNSFYA